MKKAVLSITIFILLTGVCSLAQEAVLTKALKDELARSMAKLRLENESKPYYISYLVRDVYTLNIQADSGAITTDEENRRRTLRVDLRVGGYELDNSHFLSMGGGGFGFGRGVLSLDDNYDVLRRQIWLATDSAYKSALDTFTKKKAHLRHTIRTESLPDFTKGEKFSSVKPAVPYEADRNELARLIDGVSKLFLKNDEIQKSKVNFSSRLENRYYVNSEGAVSVEPRVASRLAVTASTQADDGMPLRNFLVYTFGKPGDIPEKETLSKDIAGMIDEMAALKKAPLIEDYSGPVLFESQAAAEILAQGFVDKLLAKRTSESDNAQFNMFSSRSENPYLGKIGSRVVADTISVKALPALGEYNGSACLGSYEVDDEGARAQEVSLIENGVLKTLLMSRSPVKGLDKTNGHFRGAATTPSVIRLTARKGLSGKKLKDKLTKAVKSEGLEYGYIVRSVIPPSEADDLEEIDIRAMMFSQFSMDSTQFKLSRPVMVYRVYPDGKEELVRGAEFGSISIKSFENVAALSKDEYVYNYLASSSEQQPFNISIRGFGSFMRRAGGGNYSTIITPSFIISELDLKKSSGNYRKPPIVGYPSK